MAFIHDNKLSEISEDLHAFMKDQTQVTKDLIEITLRNEEKRFFTQLLATYHSEAASTILDMFGSTYNWTTYNEKYVLSSYDEHSNLLNINNKIAGCTNDSIIVHHAMISGGELEKNEVYEFQILGTIKDDIYTEPLFPSRFVNINGKWAVLDYYQCATEDKCTISAVSYPECNPDNVNKCEKQSFKIEEGFIRYHQHESTIQIVTNFKTFSVLPKNAPTRMKNSFTVPSSGKFTVVLRKNEVLHVGNHTFYGFSDIPTKITYHTFETKMDESDRIKLEKDQEALESDLKVETRHKKEESQGTNFIMSFIDGCVNFVKEHWQFLTFLFGLLIVISIVVLLFSCISHVFTCFGFIRR